MPRKEKAKYQSLVLMTNCFLVHSLAHHHHKDSGQNSCAQGTTGPVHQEALMLRDRVPMSPHIPTWYCSPSSKLHLLNCFILKISLEKPSSFIKIYLSFLPSVSIYKEEKSRKKDKRKAEKSMSPKAFIGEKIKVLGTRFHSTEHCSASCLTHLFTYCHQSRWQGTKGHMSLKK